MLSKKKNDINDRVKDCFENASKTRLIRKMPVIIRVDGRAFHTFTKGFKRPFDDILRGTMMLTMKQLCENIQGCVFGYEQSDEITLVLIDYESENSSGWSDYEVQKMCSISASMATLYFNQILEENYTMAKINNHDEKHLGVIRRALNKGAMFDSRCFNVPKEEVYGAIMARQLDAYRNSVLSVGQYYFSQSELKGVKVNEIQDMLLTKKGVNWNDLPAERKRGSACIKVDTKVTTDQVPEGYIMRKKWMVDTNMPIFKNDDVSRQYIDNIVGNNIAR